MEASFNKKQKEHINTEQLLLLYQNFVEDPHTSSFSATTRLYDPFFLSSNLCWTLVVCSDVLGTCMSHVQGLRTSPIELLVSIKDRYSLPHKPSIFLLTQIESMHFDYSDVLAIGMLPSLDKQTSPVDILLNFFHLTYYSYSHLQML